MDQVLAGLGAPTTETIVVLHERWADVVGAEVVAHASPVSIKARCLRIATDSSAWASHLRWSEAEILGRIATMVGPGEVTSVELRITRR